MVTSPFDVNRRSLLLGTAALAGAASAGVAGVGLAAAQDAPSTAEAPTWNRLSLGDFTVTTYLDGMRPGEGPHPIFGMDQPAEAVQDLMEENFLPPSEFVNYFTPTLVDTGSEKILFDTGLGAGARENGLGMLAARLAASGVDPADIDVVVITHMHGDHIGGLMENGAPAFANARYVTTAREYDYWTKEADAERAKGVVANVVPLAEKFTFLSDGGEVVPGITAMAAHGHTPGHTIYNIESGGRRLVLTADTANHYVASLQRPDWEVRFDMDKAAAAASRKEVFGMLAADRVPFIGYHMPFPAIGYVEPHGPGFRFVPVTYQFEV